MGKEEVHTSPYAIISEIPVMELCYFLLGLRYRGPYKLGFNVVYLKWSISLYRFEVVAQVVFVAASNQCFILIPLFSIVSHC